MRNMYTGEHWNGGDLHNLRDGMMLPESGAEVDVSLLSQPSGAGGEGEDTSASSTSNINKYHEYNHPNNTYKEHEH